MTNVEKLSLKIQESLAAEFAAVLRLVNADRNGALVDAHCEVVYHQKQTTALREIEKRYHGQLTMKDAVEMTLCAEEECGWVTPDNKEVNNMVKEGYSLDDNIREYVIAINCAGGGDANLARSLAVMNKFTKTFWADNEAKILEAQKKYEAGEFESKDAVWSDHSYRCDSRCTASNCVVGARVWMNGKVVLSSDHPAHDSRCTETYCVENDAKL